MNFCNFDPQIWNFPIFLKNGQKVRFWKEALEKIFVNFIKSCLDLIFFFPVSNPSKRDTERLWEVNILIFADLSIWQGFSGVKSPKRPENRLFLEKSPAQESTVAISKLFLSMLSVFLTEFWPLTLWKGLIGIIGEKVVLKTRRRPAVFKSVYFWHDLKDEILTFVIDP